MIVGGGPTGVELAERSPRSRGSRCATSSDPSTRHVPRIVLVEAGPTHPADVSRDTSATPRARSLQRLGIEVREGTARDGSRRARRLTDCGQRHEARGTAGTVLWAAGVAASPIGDDARRAARSRGTGHRRAGSVDSRSSRKSSSSAMLRRLHAREGSRCPGVAQTAMQGAASRCAQTILASPREASSPRLVRVSRSAAAWRSWAARAAISRSRLDQRFSGSLAWLAWLFLHIFMLIGFRNRMVVLFEWAVAYLTFQRGARLITGESRPGERQT